MHAIPRPLLFSATLFNGAAHSISVALTLTRIEWRRTRECLPWDIAFHIERNESQDNVSAQIQVRAVRSSQG